MPKSKDSISRPLAISDCSPTFGCHLVLFFLLFLWIGKTRRYIFTPITIEVMKTDDLYQALITV